MAKITFTVKFYATNGPEQFRDMEKKVIEAISFANERVYTRPDAAPKCIESAMEDRMIRVSCVPNMIIWEILRFMTNSNAKSDIVGIDVEFDKMFAN